MKKLTLIALLASVGILAACGNSNQKGESAVDATKEAVGTATETTKDAVKDAADTTKDATKDAATTVDKAASDVKDAVRTADGK